MKRLRLPKRSTKARHLQFQRAAILERLENRAMMATIAAGNEFLVNSAIYAHQEMSAGGTSVASNATGDFLVTYDGFGPGDRNGVFVRRFDSSGNPLGESVLANLTIGGEQLDASAALAANGDHVIVWSGRGPGDSSGIFARRFSAGGNSGEIGVNVTTGGDQHSAAIAMAGDGTFVVVWSGNGTGDNQGVFLRRFSAAGIPLTSEIRVNSTTAFAQQTPSISMADNGAFVVTWASQLQDGSGWGVFAQRFDNQARVQGAEFRVNTTTAGDQFQPQAAMAPDGRFVIAWTATDGDGGGIFAQQYDAAGAAMGSEVRVNTTTIGSQFDPNVAINVRGDFAVSWTSVGQNGSGYNIVAQNFSAEGLRDGTEYIANSLTMGHQQNSSLAADDLGNLVIAWSGMGQDDGRGVLARRFVPDRDVLPPVITAALANDTGLSNSDGITLDATINANINDQSFVTRLQASLDGKAQVDLSIPAQFRGAIVLDRARLEQINGGALPDGQHTLRLVATDEEGNVSSPFEFTFTLDTIPPLAPSGFDLLAVDDTGASNSDNITNKLRPTIQVAAVNGQLVQLFVDGVFAGQAVAPVSGFTQIASSFDVGNGVHVYTAKAIDVAGNHSPISSQSLTVTTDTTPPATPGVPDMVAASDSGVSQTDNITNDNTPTFSVATQAGTRIRLLVDGAIILAEGVATGATIELTPNSSTTISNGTHQITAVAIDDAGNLSAASAALTVTIDTVAPPTPGSMETPLLTLTTASNTGTSAFDEVTRDTTPTFRLTSQAGNIVRLSRGGVLVQEATVGAGGFVDITSPALADGAHTFSAVAIDPAGNAGTAQSLGVVIDTIRIDLVAASDTGVGTADNLTSQQLATLQVTAPPLSSVSITIDGTAAGTQTANAVGVAQFVTPLLSDGVHIVRATAVDTDGITRVGRGALALTIDSAAPTVATPIADVTVQQDAANTNIPLSGLFTDLDGMQTVVRFNTSGGTFNVQLYDGIASSPASDHVANFLNYVSDYANSIFHRVVPGFVAQGGQTKTNGTLIPTDPPVTNEFLLSNSAGTLSLARTSVVNSGTSQYFFSLADTSDNLNNQNQGFTVFGQVLGTGLSILTGFPEIPGSSNSSPSPPVVNSVTVLPQGTDRLLSYSVMSNSNAALVTATIVNNNVVLDYQPGQTGSANITIRAFDLAGNFVDDTFTVTVNPGGGLMSASASGDAPLDPAALASLPATNLTAEMQAIVAEAVRRWTSAGLDATRLEALEQVTVKLADLPEGYLGYALADTIWLDSDADGQGWFIDPTAGDDLEFALDVAGQLRTIDHGLAGRVDLLSAAAHELGHVLGLSHHDDGGLMNDTLSAGLRQLPQAALVDALLAVQP